MTMTFNADASGTFGTIEINGVGKLQVNADGTANLLDGSGKIVGYDDILGTVSESGGIPTGAIIERGSNANGEYVKYADGTSICTWDSGTVALSSTATAGAAFTYYGQVNALFPITLVGQPAVSVYGFVTDYTADFTPTQPTTTGMAAWINSSVSINGTGKWGYTAVGRWF